MKDKEKKIGIITFHSAHNYGAVLQAFASQKFLEKVDIIQKLLITEILKLIKF